MQVESHIVNDERFLGYVKEWEEAQVQIDAFKDLQSNIADTAKQNFNVTTGDFNKIAKGYYDERSVNRKHEEAESLLHITEILRNKGKKESEEE